MPIGVVTLANLINKVHLMLNYILTIPYCRNVIYVMWSRDHEARLTNLTLEQPLTSKIINYQFQHRIRTTTSDIRAC